MRACLCALNKALRVHACSHSRMRACLFVRTQQGIACVRVCLCALNKAHSHMCLRACLCALSKALHVCMGVCTHACLTLFLLRLCSNARTAGEMCIKERCKHHTWRLLSLTVSRTATAVRRLFNPYRTAHSWTPANRATRAKRRARLPQTSSAKLAFSQISGCVRIPDHGA